MRTTVTLDPDTRLLIERVMTPRTLGPARVDLTKALSRAGDLEDETLARRLTEGR